MYNYNKDNPPISYINLDIEVIKNIPKKNYWKGDFGII